MFLYLNDVEKGKEAFTSHDQMRLFLSIAHDFMFGIFYNRWRHELSKTWIGAYILYTHIYEMQFLM